MLNKIKDENIDMFFEAVLSLSSIEECYAFFGDVCTIDEITGFAKRIAAAKMIRSGAVYSEIKEKTGLSTATISRVNRSLKYGTGGYDKVLGKIDTTVYGNGEATGSGEE